MHAELSCRAGGSETAAKGLAENGPFLLSMHTEWCVSQVEKINQFYSDRNLTVIIRNNFTSLIQIKEVHRGRV
ncbi:hypothetical protein WH297_22840 [Ochrobactrum vermis]|uniref:Uncharacterized protein n=1 Tax=Ochrobactrum vermis TaxID=1827297 RepID=A0ABU8PJX0_9HYPH|nr:hypothetical protein CQZ93_23165 [Ochrobactrum vermis]